jgi:hypothetical protein
MGFLSSGFSSTGTFSSFAGFSGCSSAGGFSSTFISGTFWAFSAGLSNTSFSGPFSVFCLVSSLSSLAAGSAGASLKYKRLSLRTHQSVDDDNEFTKQGIVLSYFFASGTVSGSTLFRFSASKLFRFSASSFCEFPRPRDILEGRVGTVGLPGTCGFSLGAGLGGTGFPASLLNLRRSLSFSPTVHAFTLASGLELPAESNLGTRTCWFIHM